MSAHDFQKIILSVNENGLLIDSSGYITMKDRLIKLETFFDNGSGIYIFPSMLKKLDLFTQYF